MAVQTPICDFGWPAPDFTLPGVDSRTWRLEDVRGPRGTVIIFICNHCPYVKAIIDRLVRDSHALTDMGVGIAAICSNDAVHYPDDSFENMKLFAKAHGFRFPYLHDETQAVARAYNAVCTPDIFGFDSNMGLQYRGRLDSSGKQAAAPDVRRELFDAMTAVAEGGQGPREQTPSMGCSIKWNVG